MGMFDSFYFYDNDDNEEIEAQLKAGKCILAHFNEGDYVKDHGYYDGIYKDHNNLIVVKDGVFVAGFEVNDLKTKRGLPVKEIVED